MCGSPSLPASAPSGRCGVFHRGRLNDPRPGLTYDRIVFTLKSTNIEHLDGVLSGALFLSAEGFCRDMIAAANNWYYAKQGEMNVAANLQRLVQYRPHGLKP